jgi:PQQ-dependent catabolism-associated CXXCW motif protein
LWIEPRREHIPGSVWLPNVGLGVLPDDLMILFERELKRLTGGDRGRPVVFYCDADCWMSWNAAKRARHELGYGRVYWYPDGVESWAAAGHDLVPATTATTRELVN